MFWGSLDGSPARQLLDADAAAVFAPPSEVVFVRDGVLYAPGFDATRLELTGNPIKLASGVAASSAGVAAISASREVIAYRTGAAARERQFVWFDRSGKRLREIGKPADTQLNPALSPDGRQLLFTHGGTSFEYDVTADGKEFLVNTFVEHPAVPISLILKRRPVAG